MLPFGPRIMILGASGSGKSTLARRLGAATGLPVHHMDHIHWMPGWVQRPLPERIALAEAIEDSERWIFEGGLSATYPRRTARATSAIWLDLPLGLRLWRVGVRAWRHRGTNRPDLPPGCPEAFDRQTLELMRFLIATRRASRIRIAKALAARPELPLWHLRSRNEVRRFLAEFRLDGSRPAKIVRQGG